MNAAPVRPPPGPSRDQSWRLFETLAPRYDRISDAISFGVIRRWRAALVRDVAAAGPRDALDVATGTGALLLGLLARGGPSGRLAGVDRSPAMLDFARRKLAARGWEARVELSVADAAALPFPDGSFDAVTLAFGIRNFPDPHGALREMARVLRPGGRAWILETSRPRRRAWGALAAWHRRHALPCIGAPRGRDRAALDYLGASIETFPDGAAFCAWMEAAGLRDPRARPLTGGLATLYTAQHSCALDKAAPIL